MITIREVAKIAGVSISTVSRVINRLPDVSPQTRQKVSAVIKAYGYLPNAGAKALKQSTTNIIAIIVKGIDNPFFMPIVEEIQQEIETTRYIPLVHYIDESADEVQSASALVNEKKALGVIFLGGNPAPRIAEIGRLKVPCVFATVSVAGLAIPNASSVCVDDIISARMAIDFLTRHGHRTIAILGGRRVDDDLISKRFEGARLGLVAAGLRFDENLYFESLFTFEDAYRAISEGLKQGRRFTALFAMSDIMGIGACKAIFDNGMQVPSDVSVIGFDGIKIAAFYNPTLTTVRQPGEEIARRSAHLIIGQISGQPTGQILLLPSRIVVGASVKSCS